MKSVFMIRDPLLISKIKTRDMEYSMNIFNRIEIVHLMGGEKLARME